VTVFAYYASAGRGDTHGRRRPVSTGADDQSAAGKTGRTLTRDHQRDDRGTAGLAYLQKTGGG
jgi:hypothetical protein